MIAIDTNILVYAHRFESEWHEAAARSVRELAQGWTPWAIPWPCIHEFLAVVTNPRIYAPPTPLADAIAQIDAWFESPSLVTLSEDGDYWVELKSNLTTGQSAGAAVHDARIAALCRHHGVREMWTADRDINRFPHLSIRNPLVRR
ncbi:MAG: PIN domain-containing protein [Chloroflexota bacterium]|nr:MAG: PIN domain-containing protein [Chloroflexota bacterium]